MSTKRQTTFAKIQREQAVKERRARKQQRRQDRLDEKKRAAEAGLAPEGAELPVEGEDQRSEDQPAELPL